MELFAKLFLFLFAIVTFPLWGTIMLIFFIYHFIIKWNDIEIDDGMGGKVKQKYQEEKKEMNKNNILTNVEIWQDEDGNQMRIYKIINSEGKEKWYGTAKNIDWEVDTLTELFNKMQFMGYKNYMGVDKARAEMNGSNQGV